MLLSTEHPVAVAAVEAIHAGDVGALSRLLRDNPGLENAALGSLDSGCEKGMTRSLLHVATDWPGNFPNGPAVVAALVGAGADINARFTGPHTETPLHWAASIDDVAVLDALLDAGADIEAEGAVIAGGTPISDAVAFGCWKAARRLIERGAKTVLWQSAGLGLMDRIDHHFETHPDEALEASTGAFWSACHGDQREAAEFLLARGADINWVGYDELTPLDAASREGAHALAEWLRTQGAKSAIEIRAG